jgi:hypothetical protein
MKALLPTPRQPKQRIPTGSSKKSIKPWPPVALLSCLKRRAASVHAAPTVGAADRASKGQDEWYRASYAVFMPQKSGDPASPAELLKRVACAYSWVPTIARADPRTHFHEMQLAVAKVRDVERRTPYSAARVRKARKHLVRTFQRALMIDDNSDSTVIASKVMHFWHPDLAPMIDTNVAKAWKSLKPASVWLRALKDAGNPQLRTISSQPTLDQYLAYWEIAYKLRECGGGIDYHALDQLLFRLA